jgi:hypothetical protein
LPAREPVDPFTGQVGDTRGLHRRGHRVLVGL